MKALVWVVYATRSLTVEELRHAVATNPDTYKFEARRLVAKEIIIGACCGLLTIEKESNFVRLVREFLFASTAICELIAFGRLYSERGASEPDHQGTPLSSCYPRFNLRGLARR
jgi:hypothetical protein